MGYSNAANRSRIDNALTNKTTKQTIVDMIGHRKLKIEQHQWKPQKTGDFIGSDVHILFPENSKRKIKHANYFIMACILNYYA
jgi:hypothetical protein